MQNTRSFASPAFSHFDIGGYQKQTAANVSDKLSIYLSDAPHALPHAAGFSSGLSDAPHALPHAAGFSSGLSDAPHAVPQAEPAFAFSFHPAMFESAIILTSCDKFVRLLPCYRFILTGDSSLRKYAQ